MRDATQCLPSRTLAICALLVLTPLPVFAQQAPGTALPPTSNPLIELLPQLREAEAPDWVREGLRVTYYSACASIPRERYYAYRDPVSGNLIKADEVGPAGQSYVHCDLVAMDRATAVVAGRMYSIDPAGGTLQPYVLPADLGVPGAGAMWAAPQVLKTADSLAGDGLKVVRMPYHAGGKTWQAIRFDYTSQNARHAMVFDLDTGLLIHYNHWVEAADHRHYQLAVMEYRGRRHLQIPWGRGAPPSSVKPGRVYRMVGTTSVTMPGAPVVPLGIGMTIRVGRVASRWTSEEVTETGGGQVLQSRLEATGAAQLFGAHWLPAEGLAGLRAGQAIDTDPVTNGVVAVSHVDDDIVVISETVPGCITEMAYARTNGGILGMRQTRQIGQAVHELAIELTE